MKILLAIICFIAAMLHGFFGYYLHVRGESVFEPENMVVAIHKKDAAGGDKYEVFRKKSELTTDEAQKEEVKSAPLFEKPNDGLIKSSEEQAAASESEVKADAGQSEPAAESQSLTVAAASEIKETQKEEFLPFNTGWSGFLQVENALITIIVFFLGLSICCVKGRGPASRWVFGFNLLFWGFLGTAVWIFLPAHTPLAIFNIRFGFPQWYMVIGIAGTAAVLSLLLFLNAFRKPLDSKKPSSVANSRNTASDSGLSSSYKMKATEEKSATDAELKPLDSNNPVVK